MFKVRILVSQFYWFLSLKVCIPAIELKGGLVCCFSSFPWTWFHRLFWRFTTARAVEVLDMWNGERDLVFDFWTLPLQLHFHAEKLKYYQKCHMLYLVRHVLWLNKVGSQPLPHLGNACIIVIVCRTIDCVLCLLSCFADFFGQLFLFSSLNELLPFLSIMFTHKL